MVLILSDKDELIPLKRFKKLRDNFALKFTNKNKLIVLNSK